MKDINLFRTLRQVQSTPSTKIEINGESLINFSSNDYLNLAENKEIINAAIEIIEKYGFTATSSRLISGNLAIHEELETKLANFKDKQSAIVFPSGYQANIGVISALLSNEKESCIIMDKLNHASLWDGARFSGKRIFVYNHCDMNFFEKILKRSSKYKVKLAITESVFSMDGDLTPLKDFTYLCQKYGAISMVDEAHSTGVFGREGKGLADVFGVSDKIDVSIGTLSKAFAAQGGFVCGSHKLTRFLINKSRSFIYTTAISPAICAAALKSMEIIKKCNNKRQHLHDISKILKDKLMTLGFNTLNTRSQIIPIITGTTENTEKISSYLFRHGIYIPAIKPPTVPKGQSRIRLSLSSKHVNDDIEKLCNSLKRFT
jgi:8-amino-7-oxononanoate synthase